MEYNFTMTLITLSHMNTPGFRIRYILPADTLHFTWRIQIFGDGSTKNTRIVLVKSLRNCKRRNKGNFTLKYNSNKIMLYWGGGKHFLVLNKIST
jgi:hypothetical protein